MYFDRKEKILGLLVVILITIGVVYAAGLHGGYFFDDYANVAENASLAPAAVQAHFWRAVFSSDSSSLHRPLSMITFALQAKFDLLTPYWSKLINVLIHAINTLLIFGLGLFLLRIVRARAGQSTAPLLFSPAALALAAAAWWALAPIQVSTVLYVVQRMESLAALFTLLGLLLYTLGRLQIDQGNTRGWWRILAGLLLCTPLAVLAKETGILLPAYAFLIEWLIFGFQTSAKIKKSLWVLFALVLFIPGLLGVWYTLNGALSPHGYAGRDFDLAQRLLTELRIVVDYIKWVLLPTPYDFSFYHDDIRLSTSLLNPISTLLSLLFLLALAGTAVWWRRKFPLFAFGVFFFLTGQALVSTYLPLELVYEHRNYLPSFGLFIAVIGLLSAIAPPVEKLDRTRKLLGFGYFLLLMICTAQTAFIAYQWRSSFTQDKFLAMANPDSTRAIFSFARNIQAHSEGYGSPSFDQAVQLYKKIYDLPDASINAVQALIVINAKEGKPIPKDYWTVLEAKMRGPISAEDNSTFRLLAACVANGDCTFNEGDLNRLTGIMVSVSNTHPDNVYLAQTFGDYVFSVLGQHKNGIEILKDALRLQPRNLALLADVTAKLWQSGEKDAAQSYFQRVVELDRFDQYTTGLRQMMMAAYP